MPATLNLVLNAGVQGSDKDKSQSTAGRLAVDLFSSWPPAAVLIAVLMLLSLGYIIKDFKLGPSDSAEANFSSSGLLIKVLRGRTEALRAASQESEAERDEETTEADAAVEWSEHWIRGFADIAYRFNGARIVWVTDSPESAENVALMEFLVDTLNSHVVVVSTARAAVALLSPDRSGRYAAVLSDLNLTGEEVYCDSEAERMPACTARVGWGSDILNAWIEDGWPMALLPPIVFYSYTAARCGCDQMLVNRGAVGATDRLDLALLMIGRELPVDGDPDRQREAGRD